jgi:hypothetical protein
MPETTHSLGRLTPILLCLLLTGCGSGDGLARVKGKVTLNGEPLEGAIVQFQPTEEGGTASAGKTDANGRYVLMHTFDQPGALPGEHVVSIRTAAAYYDEEDSEAEERIPAKYNSRSELKRTVAPGRNTFDFELDL